MALIVITVQDTDTGAVVSLAAEPQINLAAEPTSEAQKLAHLMLGALPLNAPASPPVESNELAEPGRDPDGEYKPLAAGPQGPVDHQPV